MSGLQRCARPAEFARSALEGGLREQALQAFAGIVGDRNLLHTQQECAPYLTDQRSLYHGRALAIALPGSVDEVVRLLSYCNERRIAVVPQGGNTGYCGGATPDPSGQELVIAMRRLNRVREVSPANASIVAEAGCTLAALQDAARAVECYFPLSLGSEGSCQIGGNLATNAGGVHVLRYGTMRDLMLGLEVVLADGRVLSSLAGLRKDNRGYALDQIFVGAEGTLGIITAACLKLFPAPHSTSTALVAVPDLERALELLGTLRAYLGERVSAFEVMPRFAVELAIKHLSAVREPFDEPYPWYVLCEMTSVNAAEPLETLLQSALTHAVSGGIALNAIIAQSGIQRSAFWFLREHIPEAQRRDGGSLKHDIALPVAALCAFYNEAAAWVAKHVPEARLCAYGHAGDGNLHFNLNQSPDAGAAEFFARETEVKNAIHELVARFGGSFSAEHGIGQLKVAELERYRSAAQIDAMRALKNALDPRGIMNPGKILRAGDADATR